MDRRARRDLMKRLVADGRAIAAQFGLEYRAIEAERSNVTTRYGICYDDGTIKIRLAHTLSGKSLKYSSLVSTLCHELAHLKYFDHGTQFRSFNRELLSWARLRGIYQPGLQSDAPRPRPEQLDLRAAIRSGQLPTLRESLRELLATQSQDDTAPPLPDVAHVLAPSVPGEPRESVRTAGSAASPTHLPARTQAPSQLELFR